MPESLIVLDAALRGMLLGLALLLALMLAPERRPAARAGMALAVGLCVQVVASTPWFEAQVPRGWQAPFVAVSVANTVLFWVFARALFDDDFVLRPGHAAIWLAVTALSGFNCVMGAQSSSALLSITLGLQRGVPLLFAALAATAALSSWRADLVERRRRLRGFIVIAGVAYTLVMLAARVASPQGRLSALAATVDVAALLVIVAVAAAGLLRLGGGELFGPARPPARAVNPAVGTDLVDSTPPPVPPPDATEERLAQSLRRAMTDERAYRSENLTVASLAAMLAVPEYRLRRLVNQRLGHRNFNAFVNGYRLADACAALADPARREVPVLTIALEAGFQSIGPFNRAFKTATGRTPTDYRREKLADS
jgi:AraC-like DNA-binding protein